MPFRNLLLCSYNTWKGSTGALGMEATVNWLYRLLEDRRLLESGLVLGTTMGRENCSSSGGRGRLPPW